MKLKALIIGLFSLATVGLNAAPNPDSSEGSGDKNGKIRTKIIEKIEAVKDKFNFQKNEEVHICFAVLEDGTIEVQNVISRNKELARFIELQLDEQPLELNPRLYNTGTSYWITLDYNVL